MNRFIFAGMLLLVACGQKQTAEPTASGPGSSSLSPAVSYTDDLQRWRKAKDQAFADPGQSPFDLTKENFTGLQYYAPDTSWIVLASWTRSDNLPVRDIPDSKGIIRHYQEAGTLDFQRDSVHCRLTAYYEDSTQKVLFVMFKDLSSGKETYGGGRYLEASVQTLNGRVKLDFNRAYNPFCHYSHDYACPLVPDQNKLNLEVKAGEKKYGEH